MTTDKNEQFVCTTAMAWGRSDLTGVFAAAQAASDLAAEGAAEVHAGFCIAAAADGKHIMNKAGRKIMQTCRNQNICLDDIKTQVVPATQIPTVAVSAAGIIPEGAGSGNVPVTGQDIVFTKWAGMSGMLQIASEKKEELKKVFSPTFIRQIESFYKYLFDTRETDIARAAGEGPAYPVAQGGILAALWNISQKYKTGLEVDMKKISVRQETIEVCEQYRLNPYQLASSGCFLIPARDGKALAGMLDQAGIQSSVIGMFTGNNDKVIRNGDEIRYIDRPAPDEYYKILL